MKEIIFKIVFDDTDGYKGHGEDTAELIKTSIENEIQMSLEGDGVIKEGWKLEIIEDEKSDNSTIQKWVERRIIEEKKARENSVDKGEFIAKGGKLKALNDVL